MRLNLLPLYRQTFVHANSNLFILLINDLENQYIIRIKPLIVLIMIPKEKEFKLIKIYMYICGCLRVFTQVLLPEVQ